MRERGHTSGGVVSIPVVQVTVDADIVVAMEDGAGGQVILVPSVLRNDPETVEAIGLACQEIALGSPLSIIRTQPTVSVLAIGAPTI